jgi:hypothetical protein
MTGVYSDAADFVISDEGYKRFLKWEKLFTEHPIPGIPANIAASKMVWADGELRVNENSNFRQGDASVKENIQSRLLQQRKGV